MADLPRLFCPGWHLCRCQFRGSPWTVKIAAGASALPWWCKAIPGQRWLPTRRASSHRGPYTFSPLLCSQHSKPCLLVPPPGCHEAVLGSYCVVLKGAMQHVPFSGYKWPASVAAGSAGSLRCLSVSLCLAQVHQRREDAVPTARSRGALRDGAAQPAHQGEGQAAHAEPTHKQGGCVSFSGVLSAAADSPVDLVPGLSPRRHWDTARRGCRGWRRQGAVSVCCLDTCSTRAPSGTFCFCAALGCCLGRGRAAGTACSLACYWAG